MAVAVAVPLGKCGVALRPITLRLEYFFERPSGRSVTFLNLHLQHSFIRLLLHTLLLLLLTEARKRKRKGLNRCIRGAASRR